MRDPYGDDLPERLYSPHEPYSGPVAYVAECSCGWQYTAAHWRALTLAGVLRPGDGEEPEAIELRNCTSCGSTMGVDLNAV